MGINIENLKLHLGCGKRFIPGFIHIDLDSYPHVDYQIDVADLSIFADRSVETIYASHVLEYFDRTDIQEKVLPEWFRVLRHGGLLRVAVPDFVSLVEVYRKYLDLKLILGPLYGKMEIVGNKTIYHKTVYDFVTLRSELETAGFINVRRFDWRETIHKEYDDYSQAYIPHMDKENGILISLNVEGMKP